MGSIIRTNLSWVLRHSSHSSLQFESIRRLVSRSDHTPRGLPPKYWFRNACNHPGTELLIGGSWIREMRLIASYPNTDSSIVTFFKWESSSVFIYPENVLAINQKHGNKQWLGQSNQICIKYLKLLWNQSADSPTSRYELSGALICMNIVHILIHQVGIVSETS